MKKTALLLTTCALLLVTFNIFAAEGGPYWEGHCTNSYMVGGPCPSYCEANVEGETCTGWCETTAMFWDCEDSGGQSGTLIDCACVH